MPDATVPVKMTREQQRQYLILSLNLLKRGAERQKQRITQDMLVTSAGYSSYRDHTNAVTANPDHQQTMAAKAAAAGGSTEIQYDFTRYDNNQDTTGYTKADLDAINAALASGNVAELTRLNIDVEQLKTAGELDPAKIAVMRETLTILSTEFDKAKDMETTGEGGTAAVHATGYVAKRVKPQYDDAYYERDNSTATPVIGTVEYRNNRFLTGRDLNKALTMVESRSTIAELETVSPADGHTGFITARFATRLKAANATDSTSPDSLGVGGMITRFANQRDVDAQLTRFIDTLLVGMETKGPLTEDQLKQFAAIFDTKTAETDLQKLSEDLGIPLDTIKQWRGDPEVKQLGQGFALCLRDHHQSGNLTALFPDSGNTTTISAKDLLALKAGILDTTPPVLDTDPDIDPKDAAAADLAYRTRIRTTVADFRKQISRQGFVRANLIDTQAYASPYSSAPAYVSAGGSGGYPQAPAYQAPSLYGGGYKSESYVYYNGGGTMTFGNDYGGYTSYGCYSDFSMSGYTTVGLGAGSFDNGSYGSSYSYLKV